MKTKIVRLSIVLLAGIIGIPSVSNATDYYWTGKANDGLWTTAGNWSTDAEGESTASAAPTKLDNVTFNDAASVTISGSYVQVSSFAANAAVTFVSTASTTLQATSYNGTGSLVLSGAGILPRGENSITVSLPIEIAGGTVCRIGAISKANRSFTLSGAVTGSGTIAVVSMPGNLVFSSTTAFSGKVQIPYPDSDLKSSIMTQFEESVSSEWYSASPIAMEVGATIPDEDFADGTAFAVKSCSLKEGDIVLMANGDARAKGYSIMVLSPNTGAASLFYGVPTVEFDNTENITIFKATYADGVKVWGEDGAAIDSNLLVFESDTIYTSEKKSPKNILFLGNVTFGGTQVLTVEKGYIWEGPGTLTLNGARLRGNGTGAWNVYNPLCFAANTDGDSRGAWRRDDVRGGNGRDELRPGSTALRARFRRSQRRLDCQQGQGRSCRGRPKREMPGAEAQYGRDDAILPCAAHDLQGDGVAEDRSR